jgi:hypothetical protein
MNCIEVFSRIKGTPVGQHSVRVVQGMSAAQLNLSMLLHDFRRLRLQDWIGVVTDIPIRVYRTVRITIGGYYGARTYERSPETGKRYPTPNARKSGVAARAGTVNIASIIAV